MREYGGGISVHFEKCGRGRHTVILFKAEHQYAVGSDPAYEGEVKARQLAQAQEVEKEETGQGQGTV